MVLKKKKQQRALKTNLKAGVIFTLALLLIGGVFAFNAKFEAERNQTGDDFCRKGFVPEITAILIDHTDSFTPVQQEALKTYLTDIAMSVKKNGMLQIYSVDSTKRSVLISGFSKCNPGDTEDLENKLARRLSTVRKNYEDTFVKGLEAELNKTMVAETAQESPIMESIQSVSVTAFSGEERASAKKKLIIVSDLLEHTPELSFFKGIPNFDDYKKTVHWQNARSNMSGIEVQIFLLRRSKGQSEDLIPFWERFFAGQGAIVQATNGI